MTNRRSLRAARTVLAAVFPCFYLAPAAFAQMPPPTAAPPPDGTNHEIVVDQSSLQGLATPLARRAGLSGHVLWLDATGNIGRLATVAGIEEVVRRAKAAHINTLVMDVKPLSGEVVYDSKIAPHLRSWRGKTYDPNFDRLAAVLAAAKREGLAVFASVNVFSEGHKDAGTGPAFSRPEWQSVAYNVRRTVFAADGASLPFPTTPNEPAPAGQLSVLNSAKTASATFRPDGASAVVDDTGRVLVLGDAPFVAEHVTLPPNGKVLTGAGAARDWLLAHLRVGETVTFTATPVLVPIGQAGWEKTAVFVSPHLPAVREYELSIAREIVQNYAVAGIVFDRMRYSSLGTDFSPSARAAFEAFLGRPVARWPDDIFTYPSDPAGQIAPGPLYKEWLQFRAATIRGYTAEAAALVRATRPGAQVAVYVGSWYSSYFGVGVNWAADDLHAGYDWMTAEYNKTGYANLLDWVTTGCYYPVPTRAEARENNGNANATVEGAAALSNQVVGDIAWVYGGVYLVNYKGQPDDFTRAVRVCKTVTQGVMIFDLVYLDEYGWWDVLARALGEDATAPHAVPGLLAGLRAARDDVAAAEKSPVPVSGEVPASETP